MEVFEDMRDFKKVRNWNQALLFFFLYFTLGVILYGIALYLALLIQPDLLVNAETTGTLSGIGGIILIIFFWSVIFNGAFQITNVISKEKEISFFYGIPKFVLVIIYILIAFFISPAIMGLALLVIASYMTTLPSKRKPLAAGQS